MTATNQNSKSEMLSRLEGLAYRKTVPFCYSCYVRAPSGRCALCGSDDLMRELANEGVEFSVGFAIEALLRDNITPLNVGEAFEESVREIYPEEVTVGWMQFDAVTVIKEMDAVSWRIAEGEWLDQEIDEERVFTFDHGSIYYSASDLESYLDEQDTAA